jgi:hypothetical protein
MKRYIATKLKKKLKNAKGIIKVKKSNAKSWTGSNNIPDVDLEDEEDSSEVRFTESLHELQSNNLDTDGLPVSFFFLFFCFWGIEGIHTKIFYPSPSKKKKYTYFYNPFK